MAYSRARESILATRATNSDPLRGRTGWPGMARMSAATGSAAKPSAATPGLTRHDKLRIAQTDLDKRLRKRNVLILYGFGSRGSIGREKLTPFGLKRLPDSAAPHAVIPVKVVIKPRCNVRPGSQWRAQKKMLQRLQGTPVDHLLAAAGERILMAVKVEINGGDIFAGNFDFTNVATAQTPFVRQTNEGD